jgi:very-short-patch-repair endonuclease
MRRTPTFAEKRLWKELRETKLHFRRQAPLGPYIVDFVRHEHRLVIELDGGVHNLPEVAARDEIRELWLTARGYRVMRFANEHAVSDTISVVQMILARVSADTPTPNPSPQGGGGY